MASLGGLRLKEFKRGSLTIRIGGVGATFTRENKVVATAKYAHRIWILRIPGHEWPETADMPVSRLRRVPGDKLEKVAVKGFESWQACADEIERVHSIIESQKSGLIPS